MTSIHASRRPSCRGTTLAGPLRSTSRARPLALVATLLTAIGLHTLAMPAPAQQLPTDVEAAWRAVIDDHRRTLEAGNVVGGSVALVHGGEIAAIDHYGLADLESGRPVDEHTIYHWASVTKTLTAVAFMQLRDRGLVALDDPAVRYVPELRAVHNPHGSNEAITLRHLLSHTAGFRSPTWPWGGNESWHPFEPTEWSQLVAMMPYTEVSFRPGSRYSYSNPGIIFVGRTIEAVSGDTYEAYIDKNLFRPLDMRWSYFNATPWHLSEHRSNSYRLVDGEPVAIGPEFNTGITTSNGGLNAPVGDLAKWVSFLLGSRRSDRVGAREVLARTSLREMWEPILGVEDAPLGPQSVGLSFFVHEHNGRRLVGHTGSQQGFRTFILLDPDGAVGAIGVINTAKDGDSTPTGSVEILEELQRRLAGEVFPLLRGGRTAGAATR